MVSITILAVLVCCCLLASSSTPALASFGFTNCTKQFIRGFSGPFIPYIPDKGVELCRDGYIAIAYDTEMRDPAWSAYYITPDDVEENIPGRKSFYEDPDLKKADIPQAAVDAEVWGTEWNRGHLAPSRAMSYSEEGKRSSYTMANVAPQEAIFNQRTWQYLESDVFAWIGENKPLHIVTGVAYRDRAEPRWGPEGEIAKPDYYWKVICQNNSKQSAGFWGYNEPLSSTTTTKLGLTSFTTVEEIEKLYGGRIFPEDECNTHAVDEDFWGWSTKSYERGAKAPLGDLTNSEVKKLFAMHKMEYRVAKHHKKF